MIVDERNLEVAEKVTSSNTSCRPAGLCIFVLLVCSLSVCTLQQQQCSSLTAWRRWCLLTWSLEASKQSREGCRQCDADCSCFAFPASVRCLHAISDCTQFVYRRRIAICAHCRSAAHIIVLYCRTSATKLL